MHLDRILAVRQLTPFSVPWLQVSIPTLGPGYLTRCVTLIPHSGHTHFSHQRVIVHLQHRHPERSAAQDLSSGACSLPARSRRACPEQIAARQRVERDPPVAESSFRARGPGAEGNRSRSGREESKSAEPVLQPARSPKVRRYRPKVAAPTGPRTATFTASATFSISGGLR